MYYIRGLNYNKMPKHSFSKAVARGKSGPCWKGYTMVGMKNKGGKKVPNCVPSNKKR